MSYFGQVYTVSVHVMCVYTALCIKLADTYTLQQCKIMVNSTLSENATCLRMQGHAIHVDLQECKLCRPETSLFFV